MPVRQSALHLRMNGVAMSEKTLRHASLPVWSRAALPPGLLGLLLSLCVVFSVPLRSVAWGGPTPLNMLRAGEPGGAPPAILGLLILILVSGALIGLARRWPAWSYTWFAAAVVSLALVLSILADDVPYLISPLADQLLLLVLVLALAALSLVAAWRGLTEAALVTMGFTSAFALSVAFSAVAAPMLRMDIALAVAPAGLAFAFLIGVFLRGQGGARWMALLLTAVLAGGLIWVYTSAVAKALSVDVAWRFLRVLVAIAAAGFLVPLVLGWVVSVRHGPARQPT